METPDETEGLVLGAAALEDEGEGRALVLWDAAAAAPEAEGLVDAAAVAAPEIEGLVDAGAAAAVVETVAVAVAVLEPEAKADSDVLAAGLVDRVATGLVEGDLDVVAAPLMLKPLLT